VTPTGDDHAFHRGLRIVAAVSALIVVLIMIVVVQRDRPLKWETRSNRVDRADIQVRDTGRLPAAGNTPTNTAGVIAHPGKATSDLGSQ
jgi:hypothetical protein